MSRQIILTLFAITVLAVIMVFEYMFIPPHWINKTLHIIEVPLLFIIAVYFAIGYLRSKFPKNQDNISHSNKLISIIGICIFGVSIISILIVPQIYPNMDAIESKIWMYGVIVGTFIAIILITYSHTSKRKNKKR